MHVCTTFKDRNLKKCVKANSSPKLPDTRSKDVNALTPLPSPPTSSTDTHTKTLPLKPNTDICVCTLWVGTIYMHTETY